MILASAVVMYTLSPYTASVRITDVRGASPPTGAALYCHSRSPFAASSACAPPPGIGMNMMPFDTSGVG